MYYCISVLEYSGHMHRSLAIYIYIFITFEFGGFVRSFSQLVLAEAGFFADTMPETQENQFGKTRCRYKQHLLCQRVIRRYNANLNT